MKRIIFGILFTIFCNNIIADVAPNPIVIKGIYTKDNCKIRMKSEIVRADLFNDSARVECEFEMLNYGDSTTIEVGFPEMNFQYWSMENYNENDKKNFRICVDGNILTENQIAVPKEMTEIYNAYMKVYAIEKTFTQKYDSIYLIIQKNGGYYKYESKEVLDKAKLLQDSLIKWRSYQPHIDANLLDQFDSQMKNGNYPWYVWKVHFRKDEKKIIKVSYSLPSGAAYGAYYRYFKYILETGSGWFKDIENADIILNLHNISRKRIEEISPKGYIIDKSRKTISWNFKNLEPTKNDDIYVRYYNQKERNHCKILTIEWELSRLFRFLNPKTW